MTATDKPANDLNAQRRRAVQLRLSGKTLAVVSEEVGLSTPTIVAAVKAFKSGGWAAVDVKPRGRPKHSDSATSASERARTALLSTFMADQHQLWTTSKVRDWLKSTQHMDVSLQTAASYLQSWNWLPENQQRRYINSPAAATQHWLSGEYSDFKAQAKQQRSNLLWLSTRLANADATQLFVHTLRGRCLWMCFEKAPLREQYQTFFTQLLNEFPSGIALVVPNKNLAKEVEKYVQKTGTPVLFTLAPTTIAIANSQSSTQDTHAAATGKKSLTRSAPVAGNEHLTKQTQSTLSHNTTAVTGQNMTQSVTSKSSAATDTQASVHHLAVTNDAGKHVSALPASQTGLTHLQRLEAESIQIMREVVAEANNPVMLYSVGKDSAVMMHLARKAFFPANPPFPLLHVDTTWKFQEMYRFRDTITQEYGFELLTHTNPEGIEKSVNPFTHGSALHTDIMKTEALKQALDKHGFDIAIGGARRDEEKSRAKERVFSFRNAQHRWEPKDQRPELWSLYNTRKQPGETIRAFPLSNWTELDIWQYIHLQNIPVVPLYFAAERPVVERDGTLIMVDDERMPLHEGEVPMMRKVRFRTLGCYPLTGAIESSASNLPEIIQETLLTVKSERQGRMIDSDSAASMEKKKQQGYF